MAGVGFIRGAVLRGWFSFRWCCGSKEHHAQGGLLQGLPPTCQFSLFPRQELAHPQHSPWRLHLNLPGEEMPLGMELLGALVQHPATPTTNPGMGPSPHCVLLHVCKELLSHPSQPVGYLCAAFFIYLASTFSDCPPEFSLLIV